MIYVYKNLWFFISVCIGEEYIWHMVQANKKIYVFFGMELDWVQLSFDFGKVFPIFLDDIFHLASMLNET
jgi:hypothetical protein